MVAPFRASISRSSSGPDHTTTPSSSTINAVKRVIVSLSTAARHFRCLDVARTEWDAADGCKSFQRYWTVGIEQCHWSELRSLLPETQQFLTGKLDGNRHRSDFAFPILNRAATEPELFRRDRLRVSQLPSPLLETPKVHRVVPQSRQRKMLVLAGTNVRGCGGQCS